MNSQDLIALARRRPCTYCGGDREEAVRYLNEYQQGERVSDELARSITIIRLKDGTEEAFLNGEDMRAQQLRRSPAFLFSAIHRIHPDDLLHTEQI